MTLESGLAALEQSVAEEMQQQCHFEPIGVSAVRLAEVLIHGPHRDRYRADQHGRAILALPNGVLVEAECELVQQRIVGAVTIEQYDRRDIEQQNTLQERCQGETQCVLRDRRRAGKPKGGIGVGEMPAGQQQGTGRCTGPRRPKARHRLDHSFGQHAVSAQGQQRSMLFDRAYGQHSHQRIAVAPRGFGKAHHLGRRHTDQAVKRSGHTGSSIYVRCHIWNITSVQMRKA